jgi:hypothetical protein
MGPWEVIVVMFIIWVLPIIVGNKIGKGKGRTGWAWGLLLGWLGVVIVALLSPTNQKSCPQCAESVQRGAQVCRYCGYRFIPPASAEATPT